jgi:HCOMODA/2-hydroxy-3-carboxy-muconic semialdehyde decarboxylase
MSTKEEAIRDLVVANRILAHENVVDAYGHVSIRHPTKPDHFLLSRSRSPELVEAGDIIEFALDGTPVGDTRPPYLERFIHGGIYAARPEVQAVVHAHAEDVLPFGLTDVPLRPVFHAAADMGNDIPVWDIADKFGDDTDLLVRNVAQGQDLAQRLGGNTVVLMRGHGFTAAADSLMSALRASVYLPTNARILMEALRLGGKVKAMSPREVANRQKVAPNSPERQRAWEYWARRAGCSHLLG